VGRPTIIFVAPRPPYPLNGGMAIRQFHILRAYAQCGRVKLVFFYKDIAQLEAAKPLAAYCESLHPVAVSSTYGESVLSRLPRWRRRLDLTWRLQPRMITSTFSSEMARVVENLSLSADLVHIARLPMVAQVGGLVGRGVRPNLVLDLDDVETALRRRAACLTGPIWKLHRLVDYSELLRLWAYERQTIGRFDRVFVCSDRDRERLRRPNVMVVPNGADVPAELPRNEPDGRTMLFCGVLSSRGNVDALEFFVGHILPEIQREIPDARLLIVGRAPVPRVRRLDNGGSVRIEADVPSVAEYYRQAALTVVPLRIGAGTRLKILEAWALGVPIVSTSVGCEGLGAVAGEHLLLADDPRQFARSCIALLRNPPLRQQLIKRGRDLVWQAYRWEAIDSRVVAMTQELLSEHALGDSRRLSSDILANRRTLTTL